MSMPGGARRGGPGKHRGAVASSARDASAGDVDDGLDAGPGESATAPAVGRARDSATWGVVDQGLFGASNLLSNLILARWLPTEQYGAFATALAVLFLLGVLHAALFVEPMLVLGAKRRAQQSEYLQLLTTGHTLFGAAGLAACLAVGSGLWWSGRQEAAEIVGALGLALPCVLAAWLTRRMFYLRSTPRDAALASAVYLLLILAGFGVARQLDMLSAATALLIMAITSAVVSALLMSRLGVQPWKRTDTSRARRLLAEHWGLSRWLVLVVPFEWLPGNYYYLALPTIAGLGEPALLKASMNFVQPLMQVFAAMRLALTPRFVAAAATARIDRVAWRAVAVTCGAATAWYGVLFVAGDALADLLYDSAYPEVGGVLRVLGLLPIFFALGTIGSGLLRARERTRHELWAGIAASIVSLAIGIPLMIDQGALGAAYAVVAGYAALATCRFALLAWR